MSTKTRADSVLGTLPDDRQDQIADYARTHTLDDTIVWLKADGVRISRNRLSVWLSSYTLRRAFTQAANSTSEFQEFLKAEFPDIDPAELDRRASLFFQAEAMKAGDADTYLNFATARSKADLERAKLAQRERVIDQNDRRIALLEKKAAQADAAQQVLTEELSPDERLQRIRQIFGMPA
jgi:hypothetical protein